jgi:hypothetical protein
MQQGPQPRFLVCHDCGTNHFDLGKRLPHGWKRQAELVYCPTCWASNYILRAIALPIAAPLDCGWKEFRTLLHQMWAATTQASNWLLRELYIRDVNRGEEMKMPAMPNVYLYPEVRERFPNLPPQTVATLEYNVKRRYRSMRYNTVWRCFASLPTYRYPAPFPVHNQSWTIQEQDFFPVISVRMGGHRTRFRLKCGARYQRQLQAVSKIISGEAIQGELSIYKHADNIMCRLVAWLPRTVLQENRSGVLTVRTSQEAMIEALNPRDDRVWTYNGDQIRRWQAEHRVQLQRWAEDTKAEHRPVPPFAERRANAVRKYRDRTKTACHTIASLIVNYAIRGKFECVRYDDSNKTYCEQFPWYELKMRIAQKCDAARLIFEEAASGDNDEVDKYSRMNRATG